MNETSVKEPGVDTYKDIPDILGALILIILGVILFLNNFGIVSWNIWYFVFQFWPAIFIFIGLDMISSGSYLLKAITSIIGIIIFSFILIYSLYTVDPEFKNYIDKNFPSFQKIYYSIPLKSGVRNPNSDPFQNIRV